MPSELLSSVVGGGGSSPFPFPQIPTPLVDEGFMAAAANRIPHNGTLVDNIKLPNGFATSVTGSYEGYLGNTLVWTVSPTDLNAACDGFWGIQALWYDSVNDRLYVFGVDSATTPDTIYTAYITLETGAVTNVGSALLTSQPTSPTTIANTNVHRTAIDSGNFTIYAQDRTIVINESTGAEVSNVASTNAYGSVQVGTYTTLDGTIRVHRVEQGSDSNDGRTLMTKNGNSWTIQTPNPLLGAAACYFYSWGDVVKVSLGTSTSTTNGLLRTFNRSQFDAWLQEVAKFGGIS